MIQFVNAKINIGLQIVRRREDGYHDLQTIFYPIGIHSGTPRNPSSFCDILEISPSLSGKEELVFTGRPVNCDPEKNLVTKGARKFSERFSFPLSGLRIHLDKHIPDGAGIGGGSADASFTLRALRKISGLDIPDEELAGIAGELGADCPFFIYNRPMYAEGRGDLFSPVELDLTGKWIVLVKPDVYVSTAAAFAGVTPHKAEFDLRDISKLEISEWNGLITNDFEKSIFPQFPILAEVKERLSESGAVYASMSGSGSSIYGIFNDCRSARQARNDFISEPTIEGAYLLKL